MRIDVLLVRSDDTGCRYFLPLLARELAWWHRGEPDVGIEADLMAIMIGQHRSTPRLREITHQQSGPADLGTLLRQALKQADEIRVTPHAVAREPHHLPGPPLDRQCHRTGEASLGIETDRPRLHRSRSRLAAEQLLGRNVGVVRIGERRQRPRVKRPFVLRPRGIPCQNDARDEDRHHSGQHARSSWLHSASSGSAAECKKDRATQGQVQSQYLHRSFQSMRASVGAGRLLTCFMEGMASAGYTDSLEDAKREFAAAWRRWLAKTGKDEQRTGRSMVVRWTSERPLLLA